MLDPDFFILTGSFVIFIIIVFTIYNSDNFERNKINKQRKNNNQEIKNSWID